MNAKLRFAAQSILAVLVLAVCSSCPQNEATFEVYLLNLHDTDDINFLTFLNLETELPNEVWDSPIPPGGFERIVLPLAPYASDATQTAISAGSSGRGFTPKIDGTPLIYAVEGQGSTLTYALTRGGDTFNKILTSLSTTMLE